MLSTEARTGAASGSCFGTVSTAFLENVVTAARGDAAVYAHSANAMAHWNDIQRN